MHIKLLGIFKIVSKIEKKSVNKFFQVLIPFHPHYSELEMTKIEFRVY